MVVMGGDGGTYERLVDSETGVLHLERYATTVAVMRDWRDERAKSNSLDLHIHNFTRASRSSRQPAYAKPLYPLAPKHRPRAISTT